METIKNTKYSILTEDGFQSFDGIRVSESNETIKFIFSDDSNLECTLEHRLHTESGWKFAKDIQLNEKILPNNLIVIEKIQLNETKKVYDILESDNHNYITNNVSSHNCSFMGSSNTLIPSRTLIELVALDPEYINEDRNYRIYKQPVNSHEYVACVDTARGKGLDYSTISVIDITDYPFEQVAVFKDNEINAVLFPEYILSVCTQYNDAYVLVETNDNGEEVVNRLNWDFEYEKILSPNINNKKYALGMRTTTKTKRIGCNNVRDLIVNKKLIIHDEATIFEFANFIIKGNSYEAEKGFHDDLVMTLVIFAWLVTLPDFEDIRQFNFKRKVYEKSQKDIYEELIPFGFIDDGLNNDNETEIIIEDGELWTTAIAA